MNEEILIGRRYKLNDPNNYYDGIILTVAYVENAQIVRFKDAPMPGFGTGLYAFQKYYELID